VIDDQRGAVRGNEARGMRDLKNGVAREIEFVERVQSEHAGAVHGHADFVVLFEGPADDELARHLAGARALLFPSLAEGFGLPLVEALQSGTPVIASDLPVFREIGQGIPDLLDPIDGPAWERAILAYAEADSAPRSAQLKRMAGYRAPTWDEHFSKVDAWLAAL